MDTAVTVALIGGFVAWGGHILSNTLDRRRTLRLNETELKITRYQEFLLALSAFAGNRTYDAQLDFVKSLNVICLMGSKEVVKQVNALVANYNSPKGTGEAYWRTINSIIFAMRCDLYGKRESEAFARFDFPIIETDISPDTPQRKKTHDPDKAKAGGHVA